METGLAGICIGQIETAGDGAMVIVVRREGERVAQMGCEYTMRNTPV